MVKLFTGPLFKTSVIVLLCYCAMQFIAAFQWPELNEWISDFLVKTGTTAIEAYYVMFGVIYVIFFLLAIPRALNDAHFSKLEKEVTHESPPLQNYSGSYSSRKASRQRSRRATRRRV